MKSEGQTTGRVLGLLRRAVPWLAVAGLGYLVLTQMSGASSLPEGRPAPPMRLTLSDGTALDVGPDQGRVLVLSFWATWCPACRQEAPAVSRVHESLEGRGDAAIVGLAVESGPLSSVAGAARQLGITYPVGLVTVEQARAFRVDMLPTTYIIDRHGTVRWSRVGGVSEAELTGALSEVLGPAPHAAL